MILYNYTNFAIKTANPANVPLIEQVLLCADHHFRSMEKGWYEDEETLEEKKKRKRKPIASELDLAFYSDECTDINHRLIFRLLNQLFGRTYLTFRYDGGGSVCDWAITESIVYNPARGTVSSDLLMVDWSEGTGVALPYREWKEALEEEAHKQGIPVSWALITHHRNPETLVPDVHNEAFLALCDAHITFENRIDRDELEDDEEEEEVVEKAPDPYDRFQEFYDSLEIRLPIPEGPITEEELNNLLQNAASKGFNELVSFLEDYRAHGTQNAYSDYVYYDFPFI